MRFFGTNGRCLRRAELIAIRSAFICGIVLFAQVLFLPSPAAAELAGGSDYGWYKIGPKCERDQYGVISNAESAHDEIERQIRSMYASGQRRLRIPLFFFHDAPPPYIASSKAGLSPQTLKEIAILLKAVKDTGFEEIIFGFFPMKENYKEGAWNEELYQENLRVITQVRNVLLQSKVPYLIDLQNEGIPFRFQTNLLAYAKRLWRDYTSAYGATDTLGFSLIPAVGRVETMREIYQGTYPKAVDVHIYENPAVKVAAISAALAQAHLESLPWIVGETYYMNPEELLEIRRAARAAKIDLLFILQWPAFEASSRCPHVGVVPTEAPKILVAP